MATGLSGTLSSWTISNNLFDARVKWSETYDIKTNMSTVKITSVQIKSKSYYQWIYYPDGTIKIDGKIVETMNSATPTHSVSVKETGAWYTISGSSCSLSNIKHNDDGTKTVKIALNLQFYTSGGGGGSGWKISGTKTIALTNIPRMSSISNTKDVVLGNACEITWTPNVDTFGYKLAFSLGDWSYTTDPITPNQTTSYSYSGYIVPLEEVASQMPNVSFDLMTVTLFTYTDTTCETPIGSTESTFTVTIPDDVVPELSFVSALIDNSENDIINEWNVAVAGYTKVKITAGASGKYGSTISSFDISGGYNATYTASPEQLLNDITELSYVGNIISLPGDYTFTITVKDSRGRESASITTDVISFYSYSKPTITSFVVSRNDNDKTKITAKAVWEYSDVGGKNIATASLSYKPAQEPWSSLKPYGELLNNVNAVLEDKFNEGLSYDFQLVVSDSLQKEADSSKAFISTINVLMDFPQGGKGLGIGKIAESNSLEIGFDTIFYGNLFIKDANGNSVSLEDYIRQIISGV